MPGRWLLTPVRRRPPAVPTLLDRYWFATPKPLYCLAFLLHLDVVYEAGVWFNSAGAWPPRTLVAQSLMQGLFGWIGASGHWLPLAALVLTLLAWQVASGGRWRLRPWVPAAMVAESLLLAVPLLVLKKLVYPGEAGPPLAAGALLGLGAAVYEELVFRLYLIAALTTLIVGVARAPLKSAMIAIIAADALIFAACHFQPIGADLWSWSSFVVRALAGGYLALIYITRGLGIATGCHATHNLVGVLL